MTTYVVQDLEDGQGLDLLDGEWNAISSGQTLDEIVDQLRDRDDGGDVVDVILPHTTDDDPPLPLEEAIVELKERYE